MPLPPSRTLRLRAGSTNILTFAGTAHWDDDTAILVEDGSTATMDMMAGIGGDRLQVMFPAMSEVVYPDWAVTGIEVHIRGACTGNTNPALSPPALDVQIKPGEGNVYASQIRTAALQYLAQPAAMIVLGGPGDVWLIPDVHQVAKDAATIGLLLELTPRPWTQRPALLELDHAEIVLHLQAVPMPIDPDAPPVPSPAIARIQHQRFTAFGQEPLLLDPGELAVNYREAQVWMGNPSGTPVPLIVLRGAYNDSNRYHPGQVVLLGNAMFRCNVEKAAGAPFVGANWTAIS
jgi:hypothetical protein